MTKTLNQICFSSTKIRIFFSATIPPPPLQVKWSLPKRPLEALHDSISHALQPPKPTITACDTDNTTTSVKQNDNDNKENCATDEDSACTMTLTVPNAIKNVVIFKNGKRCCLEI